MGEHALLSASSAHRWLKCSPSVRLEEEVEDNTSIYAKEENVSQPAIVKRHKKVINKIKKYFS